MGYICLTCFNEYNGDYLNLEKHEGLYNYRCPLCSCGDLNVVEIDDLLLPIIKRLNQKGYITRYCCSGHEINHSPNTYIAFNYDTVPDIIPKGFILEDENYYKEKDWNFSRETICIRKTYGNISKNDLYKEILKTHLDLLEWVDNLESIKGCD